MDRSVAPPSLMRRISGRRIENAADADAGVALQLRLGHARGLEIQLVEQSVVGLRHRRRRANSAARSKRNAKADHATEPVGPQERRVPRHRGSPIVADDYGLIRSESVEQPHHVADHVEKRVFLDFFRPVGLAISPHIGGHRVIAGFRERLQLMTPRIPGLRKAVTENNQRPGARFGEMNAEAVRFDRAMRQFDHSVPRRAFNGRSRCGAWSADRTAPPCRG